MKQQFLLAFDICEVVKIYIDIKNLSSCLNFKQTFFKLL